MMAEGTSAAEAACPEIVGGTAFTGCGKTPFLRKMTKGRCDRRPNKRSVRFFLIVCYTQNCFPKSSFLKIMSFPQPVKPCP